MYAPSGNMPRVLRTPHFAVVLIASALAAAPASAATFTVNDTGDLETSQQCLTGDGLCTLRGALQAARVSTGPDAIHFNLPQGGGVFHPQTALPPIDGGPLTIDGATQPGSGGGPAILVDGTQAGAVNGLTLQSTGGPVVIRAIAIADFQQDGIFVNAGSSLVLTRSTVVSNGRHGVQLFSQGGSRIGDAGAPNVITNNRGNGVHVGTGTGNVIRANHISANEGLAIDLDPNGVTPNDPGDADAGPNNRQNFPVLSQGAGGNAFLASVDVSLNSQPRQTFDVDVYFVNECDPTGHGEGDAFLSTSTVTTGADGDGSVTLQLPPGRYAATATDAGGNTSEFSRCVEIEQGTGPTALPPPQRGITANAAVTKGTVRVRFPGRASASGDASTAGAGSGGFVPLTQAQQIPMGSLLDTRRGEVQLATQGRRENSQIGRFTGGVFQLQQGRRNPLTTLSMRGGLHRCRARPPRGGVPKAVTSRHRRRRLFGNARGRFRTRGRHSAATVRGTRWVQTDTCTTTTTTVRKGSVVVRDLAKRRNIVLRAKGRKRYVARAPRGR